MKVLSLTLLGALAFFPAAAPMFGEVIVSDSAGGTSGSTNALSRVIECRLCGKHRRAIPHNSSLSSVAWRRVRTGDTEAYLG